MDVLRLNRKAWDNIGTSNVSPYFGHKKHRQMFELFCSKLPKKADVLDLGCGTGLPVTKELVSRGFHVTAIDISDNMISSAKKNVPEAKYLRISMTEMKFDSEFDGVVSSFTMLCLDPKNFRKAAQRISNAVREGGYLLLSLNEPPGGGHKESESFTETMGQKMYSRPYSEDEIRETFGRYCMKIMRLERETVISKEYGKEYTLITLLRKTND
jgi:SAM-dependent methyltransferase